MDGVEEAKESEEDEPVEEKQQGPMDLRVQKLIITWTEMSCKELGDYQNRNYSLYLDNVRIKARLKELAQRQQMQVDRHEQNTENLSGLIMHYLGPTLTSAAPPTPPLLFKFPTWPLATP